jgi:small subunit ribosomal protein S1
VPGAEGAPRDERQAHDKGEHPEHHDRHERHDAKGHKRPRFSRLPEGTPRVELSRRAVEKDPWSDVPRRYPVHSVHKGKVARMQPFGAFVELEKGVDGLLHVSEIGDKRLNHPNEVLKDHQEVNVRELKIDTKARRIALGMLPEGVTEEQLKAAPQLRVGLVAMAKVVEHDSAGIWAQLNDAFGKNGRGIILPADSNIPKGQDLRKALPVGKEVRVKVVELDRGRLRLSIRAVLQDEERAAYRAYQQQATSTTVGTSLADKLKKLNLSR